VLGNTQWDEAIKILQEVDRFGSLAGAEFHPWWATDGHLRANAPLRASLYRVGAKGLLVIGNLGTQQVGGSVSLDLAALGLPAASKWTDLESAATGSLAGGQIDLGVPPRDFRMLVVE
jgi:hypothetical protein